MEFRLNFRFAARYTSVHGINGVDRRYLDIVTVQSNYEYSDLNFYYQLAISIYFAKL